MWNGKGAQGLAEDVRYYGQWMRDEAEKCIGHLYPQISTSIRSASAEQTAVNLGDSAIAMEQLERWNIFAYNDAI